VTLTGGPEATIGVAGELGPDRAAALASDPADTAAVVVTDTGLRRTLSFGYDDPNRIRRQLGDGNYEYAGLGDDLARYSPTEPAGGVPPRQYGPDLRDGLQTVSAVDGLDGVDASSSAADPFASHYRGVADRPAAAFDGDPSTAWISGTGGAAGQWLEARFTRPVFAADIGVRFVDDRDIGPSVAQVEVRTDAGTRRDPVARGRSPQFLALPAGSTSTLRITVTAVRGRPTGRQVGIAEIAVPGLTTRPELITARALPTALHGKPTAIRLDRAAGDRSDCVSADPSYVCSTDLAHAGEDAVPATRIVRTPGPVGSSVGVTVRADGTSAELAAAIEKAAGVTVRASSTAVPAMADGPLAVVDGNRATVWRPTAKDRRPSVFLHFAHPVAARDIALLGDLSGARSVELRVDARSVSLRPKAGRSQPADISGSDWTISMIRKGSAKHPDGRPVELSGIRLDARTLSTPPISTECGAGPAISVDGRQTDVAVTSSVEAIMAGAEVTASPCSTGRIIAAGDHTIGLQDGGGWQVASVALGMAQLPTGAPRAVHVTSSSATRTAAVVGAGPRSYLQLTQSFNPGWQARYRGSPLRAVRLDGWRQGFVLPAAASAATVTVSFRPEAWQALALGAGVAGVAVLGLLVVLPQRRRRRTVGSRPSARRQTWRSDGRLTIVAVALAAVLGWILAGAVGAAVAVLVTALPPRMQWAVAAGGMTVAAAAGVIAPGRAVAAFFAVLTMGALVAAAVRPAQDVTSSAP
jgi:arabinofuranan 3-O-arabinosyltransferase